MGKVSIITAKQRFVLKGLSKSSYFRDNFYFTGGTALSHYYLQHRYSDDLDFFSLEKFENEVVFALISDLSRKLKFKFDSKFNEVVYIFNLKFPDGETLKIDFGYYPYKLIEDGGRDEMEIKIDSLRDIATNKLLTVGQRNDVKDFVDLYFLMQEKYTIWDLIYGVEAKFGLEQDTVLLGEHLLKVEDFDFLPRMVKPLKLSVLKNFFRKQAKKLGAEMLLQERQDLNRRRSGRRS